MQKKKLSEHFRFSVNLGKGSPIIFPTFYFLVIVYSQFLLLIDWVGQN